MQSASGYFKDKEVGWLSSVEIPRLNNCVLNIFPFAVVVIVSDT